MQINVVIIVLKNLKRLLVLKKIKRMINIIIS